MSETNSFAAQPNGISRQSSYLSLTSGKSVYFTASEMSTDDEFDQRSESTQDESSRSDRQPYLDKLDVIDGILTAEDIAADARKRILGEAGRKNSEVEADTTSSTLGEDQSVDMDSENDRQEFTKEDMEPDEELIQDDVAKLCSDIAEAQQPDFQKQEEIERACFEPGYLHHLRDLAISEGGLLTNALRKHAWPMLLDIKLLDYQDQLNYKLPRYFPDVTDKTKEQVQMDVNRVLQRFPPNLSETQQDHIQNHLTNLILAVLQDNPEAYYYQGFHDISLTVLLVCLSQNVPYVAYMCLNQMVRGALKPFMEKTMDATHEIIHVLFAILEVEDKQLYNKIVVESRCPAAFCLPWVITWFSHTLPNDTDIFRLSDFILGCSGQLDNATLIPVFLSAALVLRYSRDIKKQVTETDIASMHQALAQLPLHLSNLEPWLKDTLKLIRKYSGKEKQLLKRAVEIKVYQMKLWDDEPISVKRRPVAQNASVIMYVSRYVFVRHKWVTLAVFAIGAAVIAQKYGSQSSWYSYLSPILSRVDNVLGTHLVSPSREL